MIKALGSWAISRHIDSSVLLWRLLKREGGKIESELDTFLRESVREAVARRPISPSLLETGWLRVEK